MNDYLKKYEDIVLTFGRCEKCQQVMTPIDVEKCVEDDKVEIYFDWHCDHCGLYVTETVTYPAEAWNDRMEGLLQKMIDDVLPLA
jgi:protein-arginine kinase activator protein McsA